MNRWETGTEPVPHLSLTQHQYFLHEGIGSHKPLSVRGLFESSPLIALCLLYQQLRSIPDAP